MKSPNGFDFNADQGVSSGVGGGVSAVTASAPLSSSGGASPNIALSNSTIFDWPNRQLLNTSAIPVLNWQNLLTSNVNVQPNLPDTGSNTQLLSMNLQVDPLASTANQFFTTLGLNTGIDPFNTGFDVQQAVPLDVTVTHRNAQGKLGLAQVGRFSANLGDPVLTGGQLDQLELLKADAFVDQGYSIQNFYGLAINQNFVAGSAMHGFGNIVQISSNPVFHATGVNNVHGIDMYAQLYSSVAQGVNLFTGSYNQFGSSSYWVEAQMGSNFRSGSTTPDYKGINVSPSFDAGSTNGTIVLANLAPNGNVTANTGVGLQINMDNVTSSVGYGGNGRTAAIIASGGYMNTFFTTKSQSSLFFDLLNQSIAGLTIDLGSPITGTEILMHGLVSLIQAHDNYSVGPLGFGIGKVISGGQLSIDLGKTIASMSEFIAGTSVTPQVGDGGTLTDYYAFRNEGLLSFGGSLVSTNFYGFYQSPTASSGFSALNAWGLYIADANAENWLKKSLAIGGTSGKVSDAGYAIEIADKKAFKWTPMTSAERDALFPSPNEGTEVYNLTTHTKQVYNGTAWI
jgi:hypothetical protein